MFEIKFDQFNLFIINNNNKTIESHEPIQKILTTSPTRLGYFTCQCLQLFAFLQFTYLLESIAQKEGVRR